jgi:pantoate kinase
MTARTAKAFAPAGVSSFFEICDTTADGKPQTDLNRVGSRGGGFGLQKGITTQVSVTKARVNHVNIFINGTPAPQAQTTQTVAENLLSLIPQKFKVSIEHTIDVPIGSGFGTSAGGALTAGLALAAALELPLTSNQVGRIAHAAEIQCKTGLGTVGAMLLSGCILTLEPGAPGVAVIDRIPLTPDYVVVAGVFGPTPTKQVLASPEKRRLVNQRGRKTLDAILAKPNLKNFLSCSWQFAQEAGFATPRVKQLVDSAVKAGAVGAAQNMVGEAVHALAREEDADGVAEAFKQALPPDRILVSKLDFQGAQLVSKK